LQRFSIEELEDLLDREEARSIFFSSTQTYFHSQNMTAGKLVGIFALNNVSHAFLSL